MPRLQRTRSRLGDVVLYADTTSPVPLHLDTKRKDFEIRSRWVPNEPTEVTEWFWENGPAGAGYSHETPSSHAGGGSEYGRFVWLRRKGVAQPAGKLTEVTLPAAIAAETGGRFYAGMEFGASQDFYITTQTRYILKVASGTGAVTETRDVGSGGVTTGIAIFGGTGTDCLYVGDPLHGIQELNGSTWSAGAAGTERGFLAVPYWLLGDAMATGGLAGTAGAGAHRLVGTNFGASGIYHVAGDPKVAANWSALTKVGTGGTATPIVSLVQSNRVVWAGRADGVHAIDGLGYTPNLTPWMKQALNPFNCFQIAYWNNLIWVAHERGLMAFEPSGQRIDVPTFIQFGQAGSTASPIFGRPRALAVCPEGLYVGYYNGTDSFIGLLKFDPDDGYRWSMAEAVVEDEEVTWLQQTSPGNVPRLWIGTKETSGLLHLYYQQLPVSGDPETDFLHGGAAGFTPATDWDVTLSRWNGGRAVPKAFRRWMLEADQLGDSYPDNTVDFQVAANGGAFTSQGTATTAPRWTATPGTSFVRASSVQIRLVAHNATNAPIIIRGASARYSPRPERTKFITYPVIFGESSRHAEDPAVMLTKTEQAQDDGPIEILDHFGRTIDGMVEEVDHVAIEGSVGQGYTIHADVTISLARNPARWDVDSWDSGAVFG